MLKYVTREGLSPRDNIYTEEAGLCGSGEHCTCKVLVQERAWSWRQDRWQIHPAGAQREEGEKQQ